MTWRPPRPWGRSRKISCGDKKGRRRGRLLVFKYLPKKLRSGRELRGRLPPKSLPPGGKVPPKGADEGASFGLRLLCAGGFRRLRAASDFARGGSSSQSPLHSVSAWRRKLRSFPCSSSSRRTRFAGLRREQRGIGQNAPGPTPLIKGRCPEGTEGIGTGSDEHFVLIVAFPRTPVTGVTT